MNTFSNSGLFSRPRASIVPNYSEFQRMARYACSLELAASSKTIGTFETVWPDKVAFEMDLLDTIERQKAGLTLSRAKATFAIYGRGTQPGCAYRLASAKHHAHFDFVLDKFRAGFEVLTLMLEVERQWQGNFFGLRNFLIDEVAESLFGLRGSIVYRIIGHVSSEVMPSHKLVRLYQKLGAVKMPHTAEPIMVILNPRTIEFCGHCDPQGVNYIKHAKSAERRRVPPSCQ
jgi:hypothetical protein